MTEYQQARPYLTISLPYNGEKSKAINKIMASERKYKGPYVDDIIYFHVMPHSEDIYQNFIITF